MMNRSGFTEETFFTFSYSPLIDDNDQIAGILDIATESTQQVISKRRLTLIDTLHAHLQNTPGGAKDLAEAAVEILETSDDLARCSVLTRTQTGTGLLTTGSTSLVEDVPDDVIARVQTNQTTAVFGSTVVAPLSGNNPGAPEGVLLVEASPVRRFDAELRSFAILAASAIAGALRAATAQQTQVDIHDARARVSELEAARAHEASLALQLSMLTDPPEPDHLHVIVRYHPAADDLTVGGDWYDTFLTQDGATTLVIGDVTGHDLRAAAAMGRLRGLIRTIAYDSGTSPARVLERTDNAIQGLNLGHTVTATSVVARIEQTPTGDPHGTRVVRWSNAGHPHPILIRASGTLETLAVKNDLLLGVAAKTTRIEHTLDLTDGDTLFLYTDGLIERRHQPMRQSHLALLEALHGGHLKPLDELADHILTTLASERAGDDVALVLVRPYPEDRPRPTEAGPNRNIPSTLN